MRRTQVASISAIIDGVEYMEGASGPRWTMPIAGVVVIVCSSLTPGLRSGFTDGPPGRGAPTEIRTPVSTLKGWRPSPLDDGGACAGTSVYQRRSGLGLE